MVPHGDINHSSKLFPCCISFCILLIHGTICVYLYLLGYICVFFILVPVLCIFYESNVLVCVYEFITSFFPFSFVLVYHWYTNTNIDFWWVGTWLNITPSTKHLNSMNAYPKYLNVFYYLQIIPLCKLPPYHNSKLPQLPGGNRELTWKYSCGTIFFVDWSASFLNLL